MQSLLLENQRHEFSFHSTQAKTCTDFADVFGPRPDARQGCRPNRARRSDLHSADHAGEQVDPDQMSIAQEKRGGAPVGFITELDEIEAASVIYLRLWCDGPEAKASVWNDFESSLGTDRGRSALKSFEDLCNFCTTHGRRPLMRHSLNFKCLGADEACFANFIACAATGEREDAMLIATLLVRPDVAPLITALAADFGHALMRMNLAASKDIRTSDQGKDEPSIHSHPTTFH